jgi:hypothetical protein
VSHILLNGHRFPVASLTLVEGRIRIVTKAIPGPLETCNDAFLTLFGDDGRGILQAGPVDLIAVRAGNTCFLTYDITVETAYIEKVTHHVR